MSRHGRRIGGVTGPHKANFEVNALVNAQVNALVMRTASRGPGTHLRCKTLIYRSGGTATVCGLDLGEPWVSKPFSPSSLHLAMMMRAAAMAALTSPVINRHLG